MPVPVTGTAPTEKVRHHLTDHRPLILLASQRTPMVVENFDPGVSWRPDGRAQVELQDDGREFSICESS